MYAHAHGCESGPGAWPGWQVMRGRKEAGKTTSEELRPEGWNITRGFSETVEAIKQERLWPDFGEQIQASGWSLD